MPVFLLDTNHVSFYEQKHALVSARIDALPRVDFAISPISFQEVLAGRFATIARLRGGPKLIWAYHHLIQSWATLNAFPIVAYETNADAEFQRLLKLRTGVGAHDLQIAAIAITDNLIVLTNNKKDFSRIPGVRFTDWSV